MLIYLQDLDRLQIGAILNQLVHKFFIKAEKCVFHQSQVSFLAYIFNDQGISMHPQSSWHSWLALSILLKKFKDIWVSEITFSDLFAICILVAAPVTKFLKGGPNKIKKEAQQGFLELN